MTKSLIISVFILLISTLGTYRSAFGGLMFLTLLDGRSVEIEYFGNIPGETSVQTFAGQANTGGERPDPELGSASGVAGNSAIFRARATIESRVVVDPNNPNVARVGTASANAAAIGGEVIVLDLRSFQGALQDVLLGDFFMDGTLSSHGDSVAQVSWSIHGLSVLNGFGFTRAIGEAVNVDEPSFEFIGLGHTAFLGVTYRWLLPDGSATSDEQAGRRPDFGVVAYQQELRAGADGVGEAQAEADFSGSAKLESVLFPDGSTPESHGIDLYFLSGRMSPNLDTAAVPEPASLALWTLATLGCAASTYRRRRMAA